MQNDHFKSTQISTRFSNILLDLAVKTIFKKYQECFYKIYRLELLGVNIYNTFTIFSLKIT